MAGIKGMILKNDPGRKRRMKRKKYKQLNFWIPIEIALEFDELLVIEQRKQKRTIKKADLWSQIAVKGIRHWQNR